MYIEFLAPSPKAGQQEHVAREIGASLIVAGFAKEIPQAAPEFNVVIKEPFFGFIPSKSDIYKGAVLRATCPKCGRNDTYSGIPGKENIEQKFLRFLCVHFRNVAMSEEMMQAYAKAYFPEIAPTAPPKMF